MASLLICKVSQICVEMCSLALYLDLLAIKLFKSSASGCVLYSWNDFYVQNLLK